MIAEFVGDPRVFALFTVAIMGGAGFLTGQALATTWRPVWQVVAYGCLLGVADRFFVFALFGAPLLSVEGYILDTAVILAIGLVGYRLRQARKMVSQYPWLYARSGPFGWRRKGSG